MTEHSFKNICFIFIFLFFERLANASQNNLNKHNLVQTDNLLVGKLLVLLKLLPGVLSGPLGQGGLQISLINLFYISHVTL